MKFEWKNIWMHKEWQPMDATTKEEADRFLMKKMPYTEDGTKIRNVETGKEINWSPLK